MMAQKAHVAGMTREPILSRAVRLSRDVEPGHGARASRGQEFWLSVVFMPAMVTMTPCWVTLTLWIVTPAGSFGMVMVKSPKFPSWSAGIPPKSVTWTWILFG